MKNKPVRLHALDTFRGMTIALMILVNSPGNSSVYPVLQHADWNGCTLADLVFPFFLFIVGLSCSQSLSSQTSGLKIIKRTCLIFMLGLFLNAFPHHFDFENLRILGVLQRIAICYCMAAFVFLYADQKTHIALIVIFLLGYWGLMTFYSPANFTSENNLAAAIDLKWIGAQHLYQPLFDPEGLLSTIPACATTLLGSLTGLWLKQSQIAPKETSHITLAWRGLLILIIGLLWSLICPLNKTIWSSSYVLFTGGLAMVVFACLYQLIDKKGIQRWCVFFDVFGVNALVAYVLHVFFLKVQSMILISHTSQGTLSLRPYLTQLLFSNYTSKNASLLYAVAYLFFWFMILLPLYRKKIYLKL